MSRKEKTIAVLALIFLACYHIGTNYWFLKEDNRPCNINELSHVIGAIDFVNLVIDQKDDYSAYLQAFHGYPPAGMVASAAYALLGRDHMSAQLSQLFFSLLVLIGIFGIGRAMFDTRTGLLAAFLCLTSPACAEVSRQYLLEWSLTATTTLAAFFLLLSNGFSDRKFAVLGGIFIGLASLCKQTFLIFLAGPILFAAVMWIIQLRSGASSGFAKGKNKLKTIAGIIGSYLFAGGFSWFLYNSTHREDIDNWFVALADGPKPFGMIFLIATAIILGTGLALLWLRSTPLKNGISAGLISVFIASLWYFPKGTANFLTYYNQMQMNVEKAHFTSGSLIKFYLDHGKTYYLGPALLLVLIAAIAVLLVVLLLRRFLRRHFFLKDLVPEKKWTIFLLLWLGIPGLAFFFINIQNEMNTVPLLPPLYLIAAAILTRLRLPYAKATMRKIQQGRSLFSVRLVKIIMSMIFILLLGVALLNGFATTWMFRDANGYRALPAFVPDKWSRQVMHRKFNNLEYLLPRPESWHENDIARKIRSYHVKKPKILIMDVAFYYSWNTFWYLFKLQHYDVDIQTQWYDDRDLLKSSGNETPLFDYDFIIYRSPWKTIYADAYNDYMDYKHLWETYAYLSDPPPEFTSRYESIGQWPLPDHSTSFLLRKIPKADTVE